MTLYRMTVSHRDGEPEPSDPNTWLRPKARQFFCDAESLDAADRHFRLNVPIEQPDDFNIAVAELASAVPERVEQSKPLAVHHPKAPRRARKARA